MLSARPSPSESTGVPVPAIPSLSPSITSKFASKVSGSPSPSLSRSKLFGSVSASEFVNAGKVPPSLGSVTSGQPFAPTVGVPVPI